MRWQQLEPQVRGSDCVHLLNNELAARIETRCRTGEGECNEEAQQAEYRCRYDPKSRVRRGCMLSPADRPGDLSKSQDCEKEAERKSVERQGVLHSA